MKRSDWLFALAAVVLVAAFCSSWRQAKLDDQFRASCAAQGYYAIITRDARACVDERVIRYEETR